MARTIQQQMTDLIVRTDPLLDTTIHAHDAAEPSSSFSTVRLLVHTDWAHAAPDQHTLSVMTGVLDHYLANLLAAGITDLHGADALARDFVNAATTLTAWQLRKNTLMATYASLRTQGAWTRKAPVHGLRPPKALTPEPTKPKSAKATKTRSHVVATSDEVLLARVAARLDATGALHRRAAALSIGCAGATTGEGAAVCWTDHWPDHDGGVSRLDLPGRHHQDTSNGWHSAARRVDLDAWSASALNDWLDEAGRSGRPLALEWSIVYGGDKPLQHQSAKNCYHALIKDTLTAADLDWIPGLTPASIGEWAAAHAILHRGIDAGAHVMGVDHANCLRRLTKAAPRAYKTA